MDSADTGDSVWPTSADDPRVAEALAAQRLVYRALLGNAMRDWIALDLSMGQLKSLMALATHQGLNITGLAELLGVGKPAASILVDRLVQLGYVERREDPTDRRRAIVAPSAAGSELVARLRQGSGGALMARWLARMAPADLEALTRGLRALAALAAEEEPSDSAHVSPREPAQQPRVPTRGRGVEEGER